MYEQTMEFSVQKDKESELKKNLTVIYDALKEKRLQSYQPDRRIHSVRRSDIHNNI